jgi:D-beta-D-heptose 7-phosphate kinase/D-beta-D-heptose 1-phosphate adenosyltransferase
MTDPLAGLVDRLAGARVLCVGDVMLDHYVYGEVERVSPEAPIPVLAVERETRTLGGAGNVLRNLDALGAAACFVSVVGDDPAGIEVRKLVPASAEAHVLVERERLTTVKTRYVAAHQQLLRADRETVRPLRQHLREDLLRLVGEALGQHQVVIVSDYGKGVLAGDVAGAIIRAARAAGRTVVVDPKDRDWSRYAGASVLKPNRRELADATGLPVATEAEIVAAARQALARHGFDALLVSRSEDGVLLAEAGGAVHGFATEAREVFDVSGAGDTMVATLAAALAAGAGLADAARLANTAAGIVVGKVGTAVVHGAELRAAILAEDEERHPKVLPLASALDRIEAWRRQGARIGFTNGCFDLLHPGHVSLLAQAKAACDRLVVGLNSDASVRRLKGAGRPVQAEAARAQVLASLASVDLVVVFAEDTPLELIGAIRPDLLVKGADYSLDQVVGRDLVQGYGGKVLLAVLEPGHSTTATIRRLSGAA